MMKIHGYTKPIQLFTTRYNNGKYDIEWLKDDATVGCITKNDIVDLQPQPKQFNNSFFKTLPDNATLYFDKSATFPRYKLEGSGYKRCIKLDKADFIVVGKTKPKDNYSSRLTVFETDDKLYVGYYYSDQQTLQNAFYRKGLQPKLVYCGRVTVYPPSAQILLISNPPKPLVWDTDLDKKINTALPVITESDVKQIIMMLNSNDKSTVDLGLRTLATFDVTSRPMTTMCVLLINNKWTASSCANSVAVETMLTSLGLSVRDCQYRGLSYRLSFLNSIASVNEDDQALAKSIMKNCVQELMEDQIRPFQKIFESANMNFKITVNVEG